MRMIAILAAYNEERYITACLEHLIEQGVEAYLLDNGSTDRTASMAERYLNRGLIGIEILPRQGMFSLVKQLERKEQLAGTLDADWFMHADPDEIRLPPRSELTLAQAVAEVDAAGYNAVNFHEFTFVPTREEPDHDHPHFQRTMRRYYPFLPRHPHRLNAWKRQPGPVDLKESGGHRVQFPGLRMYPQDFRMRHYLYLSLPHLTMKYLDLRYDPAELKRGWCVNRSRMRRDLIQFPSQSEFKEYVSDDQLDPSNPWIRHVIERWTPKERSRAKRGWIPLLSRFIPRTQTF